MILITPPITNGLCRFLLLVPIKIQKKMEISTHIEVTMEESTPNFPKISMIHGI